MNLDKRFWSNLPRLEFVIKGMKLSWPGQLAKKWSRNAAVFRYWVLTERRGIKASQINGAAFDAAYAVCQQKPNFIIPREYTDYKLDDLRYSCDAIVESTASNKRIEKEIDWCWAGWSIEIGGEFYFNPGVDKPVQYHIEQSDILRTVEVRPSGSLQERVNSVSAVLAQSKDHDFLAHSLGEVDDPDAIKRGRTKTDWQSGIATFYHIGLYSLEADAY